MKKYRRCPEPARTSPTVDKACIREPAQTSRIRTYDSPDSPLFRSELRRSLAIRAAVFSSPKASLFCQSPSHRRSSWSIPASVRVVAGMRRRYRGRIGVRGASRRERAEGSGQLLRPVGRESQGEVLLASEAGSIDNRLVEEVALQGIRHRVEDSVAHVEGHAAGSAAEAHSGRTIRIRLAHCDLRAGF